MVHDLEVMTGIAGKYVVVPAAERWLKEQLMVLYTVLLKRSVGLRNNAEMEISVAAVGP